MRSVLLLVVALMFVPMAARSEAIPEVRPFVGAFIPTGDHADVFNVAVMGGVQVAAEATGYLHLVGTFAFTGPEFKEAVPNNGHMHIYQFDVGGELFKSMQFNNDWLFRPFVGLGAGLRTYDPTQDGTTMNYPAGYGSLGAEFQLSKMALRFEARDYVTRFEGISGNDPASTRNEVALTGGVAFHLH
jgi:hypothetical protein